MSEKKIVVPDGMIQAARAALKARYHDASEGQILDACMVLVAAVQWLHDNPIVPTVDQWSDIYHNSDARSARWRCVEWQRRMFLAPVMEVPKSIATAEEVVRLLEECLMDASSRARLKLEIERLARKGVPSPPPMPR